MTFVTFRKWMKMTAHPLSFYNKKTPSSYFSKRSPSFINDYTSPFFTAKIASCVLSRKSSCCKMCVIWFFTVPTDKNSVCAISLFVNPSPTNFTISNSRSVKWNCSVLCSVGLYVLFNNMPVLLNENNFQSQKTHTTEVSYTVESMRTLR